MNVFVLCTGRCGSTTFARACKHIGNYTAAHESRSHIAGPNRFAYPPNHIEVDNRLAWFLGGLSKRFGKDAYYVHLTRNLEKTAQSWLRRLENDGGIIKAFDQIILSPQSIAEWRIRRGDHLAKEEKMKICLDYCNTVNDNIALFLEDKPRKMHVRLEEVCNNFEAFWNQIGAEGDLSAALDEWDHEYNAHDSSPLPERLKSKSLPHRVFDKCKRLVRGFPRFVRDA